MTETLQLDKAGLQADSAAGSRSTSTSAPGAAHHAVGDVIASLPCRDLDGAGGRAAYHACGRRAGHVHAAADRHLTIPENQLHRRPRTS